MKLKRLVLIACVGAFLIIAAAAYLFFWQSRPIGSGPAGPAVPADAFAHAWSGQRVLLVGMGDSVTAGFGARRGYTYFYVNLEDPNERGYDVVRRLFLLEMLKVGRSLQ